VAGKGDSKKQRNEEERLGISGSAQTRASVSVAGSARTRRS
jgi:hypothetical protein